ncbi:hypothetical protein WA158_000711 [Blastocystis sp. Blastoise]
MSASDFQLTEDKYLFTFQDETQLWISKEFIDKYQQLPFYDIIEHSEKYEDGSYYADMPSLSMKKVIDFLMDKNIDISCLNLKDSYDIYKTLIEYSVKIDNVIQSDLLFHIKELFYNYLKDNNFDVSGYYCEDKESRIPMELFNLEEKELGVNNLFTPQRKDELLYYSLLIKMMNITQVRITYDYSSNIPLEYICPSCIKDIFPSLEELKITVRTHYKKTELLLNPNSDEYIMEYNRLFTKNNYKIEYPEEYECYNESEMNEYNKISSLDLNKIYYSHKLIESYDKKRQKNEIPKLYRCVVNEAIYTNDYSQVEINKTKDEYELDDKVRIKYDDITNDKTFIIDLVSSKHGISQLLLLPSYLYLYDQIDPMLFMKLFEEGVFDSLTTLSINTIKLLINEIDENLFNKVMTTHVFSNVTELIYDDYDATENFKSIFPVNLISIIDTIRIKKIITSKNEEIALLLDDFAYTHSIHIDGIDDCIYSFPHLKELLGKNLVSFHKLSIGYSNSDTIKKLDCFENYKQNIDIIDIIFKNGNPNKIDKGNSLERFLKSNIVEHLNDLEISFHKNISMEYLNWISTLFNDNKFKTIHKLRIDLLINENSSSEYLTVYENIINKLIPKASIVTIKCCTMIFINRLICKGCFHNTTQLNLRIEDIPDDNFCKLYTTNNFPQLKTIELDTDYHYDDVDDDDDEWWNSFIKPFCNYINNNNFPSSSIVQLGDDFLDIDYIYDPKNSMFRYKYDTNSFMDSIIGTKNKTISKYEIETLFECINENKTQNIKSLDLYIYDEKQLSKLINFITTGKFPKLKEFYIWLYYDICIQTDIYKQQLKDSTFIQENHVNYLFD